MSTYRTQILKQYLTEGSQIGIDKESLDADALRILEGAFVGD